LSKFQVGDIVHFAKDPTDLYEIIAVYPYWYKGNEHIKLSPLKSKRYQSVRDTAAWKLVLAEPELLL